MTVDMIAVVCVTIYVVTFTAVTVPTLCFYFKFRRYMKKNEPALYDQIMKG